MTHRFTKDDKEIISLYALVTVGSILMVIPYGVLPFAGIACAFVGFIAAYFYKWRRKQDEKFVYHMRFIIRTGWWSSLILTIGVIVFGSIIYSNGDLSSIMNVMSAAERGIIPTENDIKLMQLQFVKDNLNLILMAAAIGLLPYPVYLIARMLQGVRQIIKTPSSQPKPPSKADAK